MVTPRRDCGTLLRSRQWTTGAQQTRFTRLAGVDLSAALISQYRGTATLYACDCRQLPFDDSSKDILIVQGGLHHLKTLPDDLQRTLYEAARVLKDNGAFVVVEPLLTTFLAIVHTVCRSRIARRVSPKIDALATMIDYERVTYEQWLGQPQTIVSLSRTVFHHGSVFNQMGQIHVYRAQTKLTLMRTLS